MSLTDFKFVTFSCLRVHVYQRCALTVRIVLCERGLPTIFFPPTMPDPKVNSLKKENESLKSEIAALKKNFEDF